MQQKNFFYNKKMELLEIYRKGTAKAMAKIEKCNIFTENICPASNQIQVVFFCKHVLLL